MFYARDGVLVHPYTRCEKPNVKNMSARYRCKSYWTYHCPARLQLLYKNGNSHCLPSTNRHSAECQANNGIKSEHGLHSGKEIEGKIEDIGVDIKKRCAEVALEKFGYTVENLGNCPRWNGCQVYTGGCGSLVRSGKLRLQHESMCNWYICNHWRHCNSVVVWLTGQEDNSLEKINFLL